MNATTKTLALLASAGAVMAGAWALTQTSTTDAVASAPVEVAKTVDPVASKENKIQIAVLLDTSSSMNGLINQTRSEIWSLVNELATSTRDGALPTLELALYEYGKPSLGSANGFTQQVAPLTSDLDAVSESLFALTTNGGSEYAGYVIDRAINDLDWDADDSTVKIVFIAGNEEFNQGPVDYKEAMAKAVAKGITVNTIFCGSKTSSAAAGWNHGATLAMGKAMQIDHNARIAHVEAPQDDEIARLAQELNRTYLAFGAKGKEMAERQVAQDKNVSSDPRMRVQRARSKASKLYDNSKWDLVDAVASGQAVESMEEDELPGELRGMSNTERKQKVAELSKKRKDIQEKIRQLSSERDAFVAKNKPAKPAASTLNQALLGTVKDQAGKKGFTFKK